MTKQMVDDYYTSRKAKLLKDFDKTARCWRKVMVSYYGDDFSDTIVGETRQEFEVLIPELPYIGGQKGFFLEGLITSAGALALYRVLKSYGKTAEEAGKVIYEAEEARYAAWPKSLRRVIGRGQFIKYTTKTWKTMAAESQKRRYAGWAFAFVKGDGREFDYGIDMTKCAVCEFFHAQGADEFAPYLCLLDFPRSKALSMGLVRTMTLAEGAEKCDFRWKKGRETKQGWPPEFLERSETRSTMGKEAANGLERVTNG
jgi:hypothetical protein